MADPRIWRPSSRDNYSDYMDDSQGLQPPTVPPKPPPHVHSGVRWRPPSRTYEEEAEIAERFYTQHAPPVAHMVKVEGPADLDRPTMAWQHMNAGEEERYTPTFSESLYALVTRTWLSILLVFVPISWVAHFIGWDHKSTFSFCVVAIIPLQLLMDFTAGQLSLYTGRIFGSLAQITLNNTAQATLGIALVIRCELKLLQSVVVGVVMLQLLLIPGITSLIGGVYAQDSKVREHHTPLNRAMLTVAVFALLIPAAFFTATYIGAVASDPGGVLVVGSQFVQMSRGMAIILIILYFGSRYLLPKPSTETVGPQEIYDEHAAELEEPLMGMWFSAVVLVVLLALMVVTVIWLTDSIDFFTDAGIMAEWFGLILLPLVTFSADILVAVILAVQRVLFRDPEPIAARASWLTPDLSIQYALLWLPVFVLLSWILTKPLTLLFDLYEVILLLGVVYLVNFNNVTSHAWTTPAEGMLLLGSYVMTALCTWFYVGQTIVTTLLSCT